MSSGFVSEAELAEQRRIRQEEWERVRTADQPLERPEETYDSRSLYERLQEQKNKRDAEYEEAHKLKNMIKGLDDDEVEFLDLVDRTKLEEERKKNLEEEKEIRDFKAAVASLHEKSLDERLKQELRRPRNTEEGVRDGSTRNSQVKLLAGVVAKKPSRPKQQDNEARGVKRKLSESDEQEAPAAKGSSSVASTDEESSHEDSAADGGSHVSLSSNAGALRRIGILPGLGSYDHSSDSECSSDTDQDTEQICTRYDLVGRSLKPWKEKKKS